MVPELSGLCGKMAAVLLKLRTDAFITSSKILSATRLISRGSPMIATFGPPRAFRLRLRGVLVWQLDPDKQWGCALDISNEAPPTTLPSALSTSCFLQPSFSLGYPFPTAHPNRDHRSRLHVSTLRASEPCSARTDETLLGRLRRKLRVAGFRQA